MSCSRRPRREVRRDGQAEYLRGCSRGPTEGPCATRSVQSSSSSSHPWSPALMGLFRSARTAPVVPTHAVAAATGTVACGSGWTGLRCSTTMEAACAVEECPGCYAASSPTASWPPGCWWPASRARRLSIRRLLGGMAATRWRHLSAVGCCAGCAGGPGPKRPGRRRPLGAGHRARNPTVLDLPAGRYVTGEAIQTSQPAGRHGGPSRAARCE
jgi:hypothetical protein